MFRSLHAVAFLGLLSSAAVAQEAAPPQFKTLEDKVSYIIGMQIGEDMKSNQLKVDSALVIRGLQDALAGAKPALTEAEIAATFTEFQKQQRVAQEAKLLEQNPDLKAAAEKNTAEAAAFLAENGKKEGVVTLPSGLQYKVVKAGAGQIPKAADTVQTHYRGRLIDGTVFDSSYDRGQPAMFGVTQVIPGWTEALQKMKVGDKWELYIPGNLAYGLRGSPPAIGPNALLIFDIELIAVEAALPAPKN
jgi:FKBP-type peptidyl-prolyl cis-trans isomerase FklB